MYKVINSFMDLHDAGHPYNVGDPFPREGVKVTESRIVELSGSNNKQGRPLIEFLEEKKTEKFRKKGSTKKDFPK